MNNALTNYFNMLTSVQSVLNNYAPEWENNKFVSARKADLDAAIVMIVKLDQDQRSYEAGYAREKRRIRQQLTSDVLLLQGAILVLASANGDDDLIKQVGVNRTGIYRATRDTDFAQLAALIVQAAQQLETELGDFTITPEMIGLIAERAALFTAMTQKPLEGYRGRNLRKRAMSKKVLSTRNMLRKQLDAAMEVYKSTDPEFYLAYQTARSVFNRRAKISKTPPPENAGE